jgi:hypothetical protein
MLAVVVWWNEGERRKWEEVGGTKERERQRDELKST